MDETVEVPAPVIEYKVDSMSITVIMAKFVDGHKVEEKAFVPLRFLHPYAIDTVEMERIACAQAEAILWGQTGA